MVQISVRSLALITAVLALGVLVLGSPASAAQGPLDGKTFVGETGEKGKPTGDKETFTFQNGVFDPLDCHQYGFTGAPYTAKAEGGAVRFEAVTLSEKEGKMLWKGKVEGDRLEGTMVWTPKEGKPLDYWFRGTLEK